MKAKPLSPLMRIRLERGAKRYEVAAAIGVDDLTLGRWEKGGRMPFDKAIGLARIYGVSLDELAGNDAARKAVAL